ncbi:PEP-CTERM sorting domain-containing protein [Rubritalea spongiae]|uniref:PEP-CTERM sorting domain-containing protein n=1 Tax=Rubritalea spongiae TaxID=430797 RepID=A0ABW5E3C5_9BACT
MRKSLIPILFYLSSISSQAAIIIQDVNSQSVTTTLGTIMMNQEPLGGPPTSRISGGYSPLPGGVGFNDPTKSGPTSSHSSPAQSGGGVYVSYGSLVNGAVLGLNYFVIDLDKNGFTDTFVEFTTGTNVTDFSDDAITRIVFEDDITKTLTYSQGLSALNNVPEPSSALLIGLGSLTLLAKRKKPFSYK